MKKSVLITGASGLVGSSLTRLLLQKDYQVSHLVRKPRSGEIPSFAWDVKKNEIDSAALQKAQAIVHLAGASVGDKRWTPSWKREILESRTLSTKLLFDSLKKGGHHVDTVVSASAVGYHGFNLLNDWIKEESPPGEDFLAGVTREWEKETDKIAALGIRVVKIRIGVVLSEAGGALEKMAGPIKRGVGSALASGNQWVSWIHIDDLCGIFIKALEDVSMRGPYLAVAPNPVTNRELTKAIASVLKKPLWVPAVPSWALRLAVGKMAEIVIGGCRISSTKIQQAGYQFKFPEAEPALRHLLIRK